MVKTGQFTTKCKGDRHSSKMANITLVGLHLEHYHHHQHLFACKTDTNIQ